MKGWPPLAAGGPPLSDGTAAVAPAPSLAQRSGVLNAPRPVYLYTRLNFKAA